MNNPKKQKFFIIIIVIIMAVIVSGWVFSLKYSLEDNDGSGFFDQIRSQFYTEENDFKKIINDATDKIKELKTHNYLNNTTEDSAVISQEEIEKMKEQLMQESENQEAQPNN